MLNYLEEQDIAYALNRSHLISGTQRYTEILNRCVDSLDYFILVFFKLCKLDSLLYTQLSQWVKMTVQALLNFSQTLVLIFEKKFQACIDDDLDMVEFLVEQGADINRGDNEGWTPLHATASCGFISIAKWVFIRF